jgi:hypothetical protein
MEASGDGPDARAHQSDRVEIGLFAGVLFGALTRLVALVQKLDLLEFLERLRKQASGVFELNPQFIGRASQVFPALDRGLGIGRISEMRGIVDPGPLLFGLDFALEVDRHALEIGDHTLDLGDPPALFIDLKFLQPDERFT